MTNYVVLNGTAVLAVIVYLLWRSPQKGMKLNFGSKKNKPATTATDYKPSSAQHSSREQRRYPKGHHEPRPAKTLNVMFNYNGHSWDAYEALGLPAGCSMERVDEAYKEALQNVDQASQAFMEAAYQAIREQKRRDR